MTPRDLVGLGLVCPLVARGWAQAHAQPRDERIVARFPGLSDELRGELLRQLQEAL